MGESKMTTKEKIISLVEEKKDYFAQVSDKVWATPELGFLEFKSAKTLMDALEEQGFTVEKGLAGIETAFKGTWAAVNRLFPSWANLTHCHW